MYALQVVVDSAATGKALLANGKLRKRVTLIPLDKVQGPFCHERVRTEFCTVPAVILAHEQFGVRPACKASRQPSNRQMGTFFVHICRALSRRPHGAGGPPK